MNKDMMKIPLGTRAIILNNDSGSEFIIGETVMRVRGNMDHSNCGMFTSIDSNSNATTNKWYCVEDDIKLIEEEDGA